MIYKKKSKMALSHKKPGLLQDELNMLTIFVLKIPSKRIGPRASFFLLNSTLHSVSFKRYRQNKKNGNKFHKIDASCLERLNTPWARS